MREGLTFEFHRFEPGVVAEVFNQVQDKIFAAPLISEEEEEDEKGEEGKDRIRSQEALIEQVVRKHLGISLGDEFEKEEADIAQIIAEVDGEIEVEDIDIEGEDIPDLTPEEIEARDFASDVRLHIKDIFEMASVEKIREVFIAFIRDDIGNVMSMIGGSIKQGGKEAEIYTYHIQGSMGLELHQFVEGKLRELGIRRVKSNWHAAREKEQVLKLLRHERYFQNPQGHDYFILDLRQPRKKRKLPPKKYI